MVEPTEETKQVARRYVDVVWNRGNIDGMDEILTSNQLYHDPMSDGAEELKEFKGFIRSYREAFPDLRYEVEEYIAEGDKAAFWGRVTGTHEGMFMGVAPTGNEIDIMGIGVIRVEDGKVAERWANFDLFGMFQQLGIDPSHGQ
ncbi:ester cyclase [Haloterrigena gelatinilytica]|uniref:ester cyclase n=1 Tax=Haloterrigena gelatinilytica TaxID=2741724 RepID=UPI0028112E83|nr:ester cyclase [Haloterrigena gelatinilytica]